MNSYEYVTKVREIKNLGTDYALAKMLGWSPHKIYQYRDGQSMDNNAARQIAEILDMPVITVIADMEAQRAKDENVKEAWKMLSKSSTQKGLALPKQLILNAFIFWGAAYCILCKIALQAKRHSADVSPNYLIMA